MSESPAQKAAAAALPAVSAQEAFQDIVVPEHEERQLQRQFEREFYIDAEDAERSYIRLSGLRDHFRHKRYWSFYLMFLMFAMVAFQCILIAMVGAGRWDFKQYSWLLPTLMIQYLVQIVGLAVFVVRSLFKSMD